MVTVVNPDIVTTMMHRPAGDCVSRNMYIGHEAALLWSKVETDKDYPGRVGFPEVTAAIKKIIKSADMPRIDSVVSLGPGVGGLEKRVLPSFQKMRLKSYVPVEINLQLRCAAAKNISKADANLRVPFGIVGDFEADIDQIKGVIQKRLGEGLLYLMLGGALSGILKMTRATFSIVFRAA